MSSSTRGHITFTSYSSAHESFLGHQFASLVSAAVLSLRLSPSELCIAVCWHVFLCGPSNSNTLLLNGSIMSAELKGFGFLSFLQSTPVQALDIVCAQLILGE